ncbi:MULTISPECIES: acyltransferase family protein [Pseudomonas]|uniref:acyltransferase family protein n=1 Tax=Pseudomonas TaxID=286 RepID=UPI000CFD0EAF|nr:MULTISPECIES: acyltransferase family protein [Pseudomonas]PQZ87673.1 O-antigen acetylase [Pseudomonas trivialis]PRB23607.1 O-antigen acetylase [Pseudomonas sp. MYb60]
MKELKTEHHLSHPKYRPDIDGLRAVAVLAVVIFHAFPAHLKGGFIGVDIFFVISGFLITTIILGSLNKGSFNFIEFYARRIKRIFPALLIILISCCAAGWFLLLADEYKQLGKHLAAGSVFISNFALRQESGYFDNSAETKPLLHLWSLGIEEQFYIIWPLLLYTAWRARLNPLAVIVIAAAISFALNISNVRTSGSFTFYSPQTRFWELLIGSALAYITLNKEAALTTLRMPAMIREKGTEVLSALGFIMLTVGFLRISESRPFPGTWALLPTLGTALIIAAGPKAWLNKKILSNRLMVWIGLISFPLYLWHWPILSFAHIVEGALPSRNIRIIAVLVAITLAYATYRIIEKPIRKHENSRKIVLVLVSFMILTGLAGFSIFKNEGYVSRLDDRAQFSAYFKNDSPEWPYMERTDLLSKYNDQCNFFNIPRFREGKATTIPVSSIPSTCYEKNSSSTKTLFIWGDSHAQHLYYGLSKNLPSDWQILQVASSSCPANPHATAPSATDYCEQSNWFAIQAISKAKPDVVLIGQDWGHDIGKMQEITEKLKSIGVKGIIFTGPVPHWSSDLHKIVLKSLWEDTPSRTMTGLNKDFIEKNDDLRKRFNIYGANYADIINLMCDNAGCLTYIGNDKKEGLTSWDKSHFTPVASNYVAEHLLAKLVTEVDKQK